MMTIVVAIVIFTILGLALWFLEPPDPPFRW